MWFMLQHVYLQKSFNSCQCRSHLYPQSQKYRPHIAATSIELNIKQPFNYNFDVGYYPNQAERHWSHRFVTLKWEGSSIFYFVVNIPQPPSRLYKDRRESAAINPFISMMSYQKFLS